MDKEMMEKVNEVLKAHGKRELSLDEMDRVTGGQTCKRDGVYYIDLIGLGEFPLIAYGELLESIIKKQGCGLCYQVCQRIRSKPTQRRIAADLWSVGRC